MKNSSPVMEAKITHTHTTPTKVGGQRDGFAIAFIKRPCVRAWIPTFVGMALLVFSLLVKPAFAGKIELGWPVDCSQQKCWVVHHVDVDPAKNSNKDFQCGGMTYEGHTGTDIAIRDHRAIEDNVNVLAAADGKVARIRNSEEDGKGEAGALKAARDSGRECGNLVSLLHENGWITEYCHMKKGSVGVTLGQHVQKGDRLGAVGQSGVAEFPHLHFEIRHKNTVIDPFTGATVEGCGLQREGALWDIKTSYDPLILYAAGFADREPVYDQIVNDSSSPSHIAADTPVLTFWVLFYGVQSEDRLEMEILDPDGKIYVRNEHVQKKKKIRMMQYVGARTKNKPLYAGTYTGRATLFRGQEIKRSIESSIAVR